ncbi:MAG: hypothetical protein K6G88_07305 [Lachnospiraceae bacterium]|nr:hypothetical protein [Lachnospiraceae bacterium]
MNKEIIISIALTLLVILAFSDVGASVVFEVADRFGLVEYISENPTLP